MPGELVTSGLPVIYSLDWISSLSSPQQLQQLLSNSLCPTAFIADTLLSDRGKCHSPFSSAAAVTILFSIDAESDIWMSDSFTNASTNRMTWPAKAPILFARKPIWASIKIINVAGKALWILSRLFKALMVTLSFSQPNTELVLKLLSIIKHCGSRAAVAVSAMTGALKCSCLLLSMSAALMSAASLSSKGAHKLYYACSPVSLPLRWCTITSACYSHPELLVKC